jgi:hypothetical protein
MGSSLKRSIHFMMPQESAWAREINCPCFCISLSDACYNFACNTMAIIGRLDSSRGLRKAFRYSMALTLSITDYYNS